MIESRLTDQLSSANLRDRDHVAFSYANLSQLAREISDYVSRGISRDQITVLFITREEAQEYTTFLRDSGIQLQGLIDSGDLVIEPIDSLFQGAKKASAISDWVERKVAAYRDLARARRKAGLNIVGNIAGNLAMQGRYEECLHVERFWHDELAKSQVPITLLCPYQTVPPELQTPLQEPHTTVVQVFAGVREEIQRFMTAIIQRAASDPTEPVFEMVQDRMGLSVFLPLLQFVQHMRQISPRFSIRLITSIDGDNLEDVKRIVATEGFEVRHIESIKARFGVTPSEYIGMIRTVDQSLPNEIIWSNNAGVVSQTRSVFGILWESGIPAPFKIRELEGGRSIGETRVTFDAEEVMSSANKFLDEAKQEVLIISPREGGVKENLEFFTKVGAKAGEGVKVKILGRFSKEDASLIEGLEREGVRVRKLGPSSDMGLPLGLYDRKAMALVHYVFPFSTGASSKASLSGIISTNSQIVSGIGVLFDNIWEESELRQKAELMKDILTHDIRNYNQIARANAELLQSELQEPSQQEFTKSILKAMDNSAELIQRTRILGDITTMRPLKDLQPVGLEEALERAFLVVRNAAPVDKTIWRSSSGLTEKAEVMADELLDQVFVNIFSNAVRYTEGPDVSIEISVEETVVAVVDDLHETNAKAGVSLFRIAVTDHGRGMTDLMKESASMRYLGATRGRGLGLSIVRALVVDRYGGELLFADRVVGDPTKGTKVELWLPKV